MVRTLREWTWNETEYKQFRSFLGKIRNEKSQAAETVTGCIETLVENQGVSPAKRSSYGSHSQNQLTGNGT